MTQAEWNARVASRPGLWQYFKMDESSGLPLDSSGHSADMDNIHGSQVLIYNQGGPFSGADGIELDFATGGVWSSVQNPPTNTANYTHPKTMEAWVNVQTTPTLNAFTLIAAGNIGIVIDTDRCLRVARWANPNTFSSKTATALDLDTWYFIMLTTVTNSAFDLDFSLYINDTLEVATTGDSMPWPVPNGSLLRAGALPAFGEVASCEAVYSNLALYDVGGLTPDLDFQPFTPQFIRYGR